MFTLLAEGAKQGTTTTDPLGGSILPPTASAGCVQSGLPTLISNLITLSIGIGGLLVLMNIIMAAYDFLTAAGDPKKIQSAWDKIWQSLVGILLLVTAVALVGIIGSVFKLNILAPTILGPGTTSCPSS